MRATTFLVFLSVLAVSAPTSAQGRKVLTVDDYGRWNRIAGATLSDDGAWFAFGYQPNDGDGVLHIRPLAAKAGGKAGSESEKAGAHEVPMGSSASFSEDSRWVAYFVSPPEKEAKKLRKAKKPVVRKLKLRALPDGEEEVFENAARITFAEGAGYAAILKNKPSGQKHGGTDLLLRNLATGVTCNIGNVGSFAFNEGGSLLAYRVDAADKHGNGLYLLEPGEGVLRPLDTGAHDYARLTWSKDGKHLAVLRGDKIDKKTQRANDIIAVRHVGTTREKKLTFGRDGDGLPDGMVVSELGSLSWNEDGTMLAFGIQAQRDAIDKDDERPNVDVWHHNDDRVQSVQQRRAQRDRTRTHLCALHLPGKRMVRLAKEDMPRVSLVGKGRWGIGRMTEPYRGEVAWGGGRADYYRIDPGTGERRLITKALRRRMGESPDGRWFLYLKGGIVWAHDLDASVAHNLSKASPVEFVNVDDDHPYEKPAWGVAGWTADGEAVILNHRYDLWRCPLNGGEPRCLTHGVGDAGKIRLRYVRLDREEETVDTSKPLLLSAYGDWTKKSGFYRVEGDKKPEPLLFVDKRVGRPIKAKKSDRVVLTMETFVAFPDYWATTTSFDKPRKVSDANPQQKEYGWGRRVLFDYENKRGVPLQATLTLPAGYKKGKRYPMLVYFYEKMSQRHHQYSMPRFDDRPQMSTYASDGYLVLMPDVVYEDGRPGDCAVDCVTSAARKAIELGYADAEHVALQGHSWGGYQSSFILTQTDMFCAVVTGAPVTNLISFYGELYKSSGTVQQGIVEVGQVRMGTTPFENLELFRSQSPWHHVQDISTPFIILHGTDDGAVDWHQGLEFYAAARRVGKQVVLLSYPGEGHHLRKRPNQIDFQVRMKQFFDHYCMAKPAPKWLTDGVPFLEKERSSPRPRPKKAKEKTKKAKKTEGAR